MIFTGKIIVLSRLAYILPSDLYIFFILSHDITTYCMFYCFILSILNSKGIELQQSGYMFPKAVVSLP